MSLRWRLALLILFATSAPTVIGVLLTRHLMDQAYEVVSSPQLDSALEAGVAQAREGFQFRRAELEQVAADLAELWAEAAPDQRQAVLAGAVSSRLTAADRVVLRTPEYQSEVLQAGVIPPRPASRPTHAPPFTVKATTELDGNWALELEHPLDESWRQSAVLLAESWQWVRDQSSARPDRARRYTLQSLAWVLLAMAVGLAAAWWLSAGISEPLRRLVAGTDAVADGRRDVQVPVVRDDELGQLTHRFNSMVRTLDSQGRRLVDLEKMEGWREMARALAHEVKNPLTPIQLTVEEIRARYKGDDDKFQAVLNQCTRIVVEEVESLRNVVARFREFSRPVELEQRPTDLAPLVRDVAAMQRDLRVTTEIDEQLERIPADPDRLRQVLMNLAANAREATREQSEQRLAVTLDTREREAVITVEDNGPGVPADQRERIFEPYRTAKKGGLGLGLALVKGIVLAHGGNITVGESRWGGAAFVITLPRPAAADRETDHA